ncbi:uncharacterized protein V1516DRAFT_679351 [Lipomyces oligophaga]|uniref:uncharacterized protein n=1 Tax=Lipomyces oligophaga TaxID=45792 RepID=UPI0034CFBA0F
MRRICNGNRPTLDCLRLFLWPKTAGLSTVNLQPSRLKCILDSNTESYQLLDPGMQFDVTRRPEFDSKAIQNGQESYTKIILHSTGKRAAGTELSVFTEPPLHNELRKVLHDFVPADVVSFLYSLLPKDYQNFPAKGTFPQAAYVWELFEYLSTVRQNDELLEQVSTMIEDDVYSFLFNLAWYSKDKYRRTQCLGDLCFLASRSHGFRIRFYRMYISALSRLDRTEEALILWQKWQPLAKSAAEDDSDWQRWSELKAMIYLDAWDMQNAMLNIQEIHSMFNNVSIRLRSRAIIKLCQLGKFSTARAIYKEAFDSYQVALFKSQSVSTASLFQCEIDEEQIEKEANFREYFRTYMMKWISIALRSGESSFAQKILSDYEMIGDSLVGPRSLALVKYFMKREVKQLMSLEHRQKSSKPTRKPSAAEIANVRRRIDDISLDMFPEARYHPEYYRILLDSLGRMGATDRILDLWKQMYEFDVRPDSNHMNSVFRALLEKRMYTEAETLLQALEHVRRVELLGNPIDNFLLRPPAAEHYGQFLRYHRRRRQPGQILDLLRRMRDLRIHLTTAVFNGLMQEAIDVKNRADLFHFFKILRSSRFLGVYPNAATYRLLWTALKQREHSKYAQFTSRDAPGSSLDVSVDFQTNADVRTYLIEMVRTNTWLPTYEVLDLALETLAHGCDMPTFLTLLEVIGFYYKLPLRVENIEKIMGFVGYALISKYGHYSQCAILRLLEVNGVAGTDNYRDQVIALLLKYLGEEVLARQDMHSRATWSDLITSINKLICSTLTGRQLEWHKQSILEIRSALSLNNEIQYEL